MKTNQDPVYLKLDSRNRVSLTKFIKELSYKNKGKSYIYKAYEKNGNIILEPIKDMPKEVEWIFKPENKHLLEMVKKGLSQEANIKIDLSSFEKDLED
jgi:hypothetical protein